MCRQHKGELLDQFVLRLEKLSQECVRKDVSAKDYRLELMRDAFIAGMTSVPIRQRLLENRKLTFQQAYEQAWAQEMAYRNAETFREDTTCINTFLKETSLSDNDVDSISLKGSLPLKKTCYFCEQPSHSRYTCPPRNATCNYCNKIGHFYKVCRKRLSNNRPQNSGPKSSAISGPR